MRLATFGLATFTLAALPLAGQTYKDPSTGVEFPTTLTPPGGTTAHTLTGTGVRTRTMLKVKVYAFGLYVDAAGAKAALGGWAGKTAAQLRGDNAFYGKILERGFAMTMRLVMTRDVDGATMAEALRCAREGITINLFLLSNWNQSEEDVRFAYRMAESTEGRVFFTAGQDLDRYVVHDYLTRRKQILA